MRPDGEMAHRTAILVAQRYGCPDVKDLAGAAGCEGNTFAGLGSEDRSELVEGRDAPTVGREGAVGARECRDRSGLPASTAAATVR